MFDIGFSELLMVGVVALVVVGPERLPKVARTLGVLFGRMQRYVSQVKSDINRELEAADLGKVKTEFEDAARSFQADIRSETAQAEREIREVQADMDRQLGEAASQVASAGGHAAPAEPAAASPQLELGIEPAPAPAPAAAERPPPKPPAA